MAVKEKKIKEYLVTINKYQQYGQYWKEEITYVCDRLPEYLEKICRLYTKEGIIDVFEYSLFLSIKSVPVYEN